MQAVFTRLRARKTTRSIPRVREAEPLYVFKGRYHPFIIRWQDLFHLYLYLCLWTSLFFIVRYGMQDERTLAATIVIGFMGIWRFSWWTINLMRSLYFGSYKFPRMRSAANITWDKGWRPRQVHFVMTTFHEQKRTTELCLKSIIHELRDCGIKGTLWIGTGAAEDEREIQHWMENAPDAPLEVMMIRQNLPGKRCAIALTLRALSRNGVRNDDIVVMMDGDSIFMQGCLKKCLPLFGANPKLQALTTDEDALCDGPVWAQKWLNLRFAQRRMWMRSHAVSNRVLTLTGRMSIFRAPEVVEDEFIRMIEVDFLEHWLWGKFRFLSGDDKSTWYCVLKRGGEMTFVPDAMVYTIEHIDGSAIKRARENLLRWSGNMLRNGLRAIVLGPRAMPFFIWWCLIDQRLAIWSTLAGFFTAISVTQFIDSRFIFVYIVWIMATRFLMSIGLWGHSQRIHMSYPLILYINQLILAFVKLYILFRLPLQRWANRKDQKSGLELMERGGNRFMAGFVNSFYLAILLLVVLLASGVVYWPDINEIL